MKTVLQFSGGKDSLACLYLLRPQWDEITVAWCNSGASLPETIEFMACIRELVPHFLEVKGEQTIKNRGWPADVVPARHTVAGALTGSGARMLFQTAFDCCAAALWTPLARAMKEMGATVIVRGQRNSDPLRPPIQDGMVFDGIEYRYPIATWTDADVERYLRELRVTPVGGGFWPNSSLDCWNCTAYLSKSGEKLRYLKRRHPQKFQLVRHILHELDRAVKCEQGVLRSTLAECA